MKRILGLAHLTTYGIGMIVGAGIYSVIGQAAGVAGETVWLSFIIAGIAAFLTALSYAELSSMFPRTGAEYTYLKSIFPQLPLLAFMCGSMMVFAGACTAATVATAFSGYLHEVLGVHVAGAAFMIVLVFSLLNIWGLKEATWINMSFTALEVIGLFIFIFLGLKSPHFGENISLQVNSGTISGAAMIIFAYFGFENIVNFAEETREPEKKLPRAIILSLLASSFLYVLVSFAALGLATPAELAKTNGPLSAVLKNEYAKAALVIGAIAMFSTANTILISILSTSRVIFSMSREQDLPQILSRLSKKRETPWVATLALFSLTSLLLPAGGIKIMASASSFATMSAFILINLALIHLRFVRPDLKRPFRIPGNIGLLPLIPTLAVLISFSLMFFYEIEVYFLTFSFLAFVFILYLFRDHLKKGILK
ncbi:putative amino acid permease YhdG [compost metagenome]